MGDLRDWSPEPNGAVFGEWRSSPPSSVSCQTLIDAEYWLRAEEAAQGIIALVQPTVVSEERRKAVIDYVQRLIRNCLGCEVFPFGSVPLKTYLPDGDIDLTAFGGLNVEEALAKDVCSVLEREDQNSAAEFIVKDVQLIRAEVKLVKCLVQNIVVDVSFNQLGGLSTLCFLEQVDRLIGKDHLFKRSIILIKAWCYYESRILGAHHGLISTYALETLVLYIFHLFHSSLHGPLAVLYKFLDYFSKFEWETYCISLNGPVWISSLPEVVAEVPENAGEDLLLSNDFLKGCVEMYSVPSRGFEPNLRTFPLKHLNIVDPLKENNNLGRSVSKGNFYRIRSAFTYGARKLGRILSESEGNIADELCKFFSNTLDRHGNGRRPDVQDPPVSGHNVFGATVSTSCSESFQEDQLVYELESPRSSFPTETCVVDHGGAPGSEVKQVKISGIGKHSGFVGTLNDPPKLANGTAFFSDSRLCGDAKDLATYKVQGLTISDDSTKPSSGSDGKRFCPLVDAHHPPHLYLVKGNEEMRNGIPEWKQLEDSNFIKRVPNGVLSSHSEEADFTVQSNQDESHLVDNQDIISPLGSKHRSSPLSSNAGSSEDFSSGYSGLLPNTGNSEATHCLTDLSGDYETHLSSLHYGRCCYDYFSNAPFSPMSSPFLPQFQNKNPWEVVRRSVHLRHNVIPPQMNANGSVHRPVFYPMNAPMIPGAAIGMEEMPKPRGTGTYFPNTTHYRDRTLAPRGRNQAPVRSPHSNGRIITTSETNLPDRSNHDLAQAQFHVPQFVGNLGSSDLWHSGSSERNASRNVNGPMQLSDKVVESRSIGHPTSGVPSLESSRQPSAGPAFAQNSGVSLSSPTMHGLKPVFGVDQERITVQSYHLKDEEDFPPLSV